MGMKLNPKRHRIKSEAEWKKRRRPHLTASVLPAIFGFHPFETVFGLHARFSGMPMPDVEQTVVMERGRDFEPVVARRVQRAHPNWKIRQANVYICDAARRLGATPDYFITTAGGRRGVLQCKTVAPFIWREQWTETRAPTWIVLQTLTEAMLARVHFGIIAVMVIDGYRNPVHEYEVPRHEKSEQRLLEAVEQFWSDVDNRRLPKPDYSRDGALIAAMHKVTPGKLLDLTADNRLPELLAELEKLSAENSDREARQKAIKSEIFDKIGDAELVVTTGWKLSAKEIHKRAHEVKETHYRDLRARRDPTQGKSAA